MTSEQPRVYSLKDFAKTFNVSIGTVYNELKDGRLHATKIGTRTLITREQAEEWLKCLPTT